jgi:hypothetical protein
MGRWIGFALLFTGCVEALSEKREEVRFVDREPLACRGVEAVEVESDGGQCTTREQLLHYAAMRGANYVVLDSFTVLDALNPPVIARARLFACRQ